MQAPNTTPIDTTSRQGSLGTSGFAFVPAARMLDLLAASGPLDDWQQFAASWDDLALDTYMADGGRYRKRRHAVFHAGPDGAVVRQPHQPHYQGLDYNHLNGGIERWFEPVQADIGDSRSLATILNFCRNCFGRLSPDIRAWNIEIHQFRIEAQQGSAGRPTPEGMHRDGVDYVLVLLIRRENIVSGTTTIADLDKRPLGSFTLIEPLDAAVVDDRRVYHGVTPVESDDPSRPAFRDVLVVTFKNASPR